MTTTALPPTPGVHQQVPLASILTDELSQARVKVRPAVIRAYARAMSQQLSEGGLRFPAIVLFTDTHRYWLGDGFHRVLAARQAGLSEFSADVRPGTQRDALLCSISSNSDHGLPRTNADKRKAVLLLLADAEWSQWSDREIARRCQVSQRLVSNLRRGASEHGAQIEPRKVKRGDTVYEMRANGRVTSWRAANRRRTGHGSSSAGIRRSQSTRQPEERSWPKKKVSGTPRAPTSAGILSARQLQTPFFGLTWRILPLSSQDRQSPRRRPACPVPRSCGAARRRS